MDSTDCQGLSVFTPVSDLLMTGQYLSTRSSSHSLPDCCGNQAQSCLCASSRCLFSAFQSRVRLAEDLLLCLVLTCCLGLVCSYKERIQLHLPARTHLSALNLNSNPWNSRCISFHCILYLLRLLLSNKNICLMI